MENETISKYISQIVTIHSISITRIRDSNKDEDSKNNQQLLTLFNADNLPINNMLRPPMELI